MRLMVAEDDDALAAMLVKRLTAAGYAVDACRTGTDALDYARALRYDGIILDILMPGMSGLDVLRRLREEGCGCPVMMLTALDGISDRVRGLDAGADDYLVKPFALEELLARVRALLRKQSENRSPLLTLDTLTMDTSARIVRRGQRLVSLTAKEYALLEYFMRNAGQVLTRDQIADHVWNYESSFETNLVDVYVRYLRGKIDRDEPVKLLHTVRGMGYVLRTEA